MAKRIQKRRASKRKVASVPMAPMIDMVFLLLVFFMTASAMSQAGNKIELDLPEAPSSQVPKELTDRFIVSVGPAGELFLSGAPIEKSELEQRLRRMAEQVPGAKLRIRADRSTDFAAIKEVMTVAAEAGISQYLYATYQGEAQ